MSDLGTDAWTVSELRLRLTRDRLHDARLDGLLVSHPPNIRYLSGFTGSSGVLLVEPAVVTLCTDFRYESQARSEVPPGVSVCIARNGLFTELATRLDEGERGRRIGFEEHGLTVRDRRALGEACGGVVWEPSGRIVDALRTRKDADEVGLMEEAIRVAEGALGDVVSSIRVGCTERELAAELEYRLRLAGSDRPPFPPIVASGPRSALPHASPGDRRLEEGDPLLIDFGASVGGYCSDMTRVFVLGRPAEWLQSAHRAVRDAVASAVQLVAPGVPARDVDRAARSRLDEAGLGDLFGHGTGHGLGLEVHEMPRLNRHSADVIEVGNVVTIEPGVYLPGRGGVRIEEVVVAEEEGARLLTGFTRELLEL